MHKLSINCRKYCSICSWFIHTCTDFWFCKHDLCWHTGTCLAWCVWYKSDYACSYTCRHVLYCALHSVHAYIDIYVDDRETSDRNTCTYIILSTVFVVWAHCVTTVHTHTHGQRATPSNNVYFLALLLRIFVTTSLCHFVSHSVSHYMCYTYTLLCWPSSQKLSMGGYQDSRHRSLLDLSQESGP